LRSAGNDGDLSFKIDFVHCVQSLAIDMQPHDGTPDFGMEIADRALLKSLV